MDNRKSLLFIRYYFIIGGLAIILFFAIYTSNLLHKVRNELEVFPKIYARFVKISTKENIEGDLLEIILSEVVKKIDYPIIVTDGKEEPKYWKNLEDYLPDNKISNQSNQKQLRNLIEKMKSDNSFIVLTEPTNNEIISKIFYSQSSTIKRLKFLPYLEFFIVLLFIAAGVIVIITMKRREKEHLWIALAKETAHQFGTPITSLLGWVQMLELKVSENSEDELLEQTVLHMKQDIARLQNVASRFGKVGSSIKLKESDISQTIQSVIEYFKARIPKESNKIEIEFINETKMQDFLFDPDLIKWALENLIKNSIDAMKEKSGIISIKIYEDQKFLYIRVTDQGKGIPKNLRKSLFKTGVTTKKRGWGLGLSLTKRIVEDFHHGKIYIVKSESNKGSIIEIKLKKDKE
ncbi:MAG: HAMP domain-containing sensor histidine kinase [Candidatus Cloacimonadota bacterium]|nr:HAMP domain-containing sensor histidine kinase [Candidatus Cloacimonadota bacterium]